MAFTTKAGESVAAQYEHINYDELPKISYQIALPGGSLQMHPEAGVINEFIPRVPKVVVEPSTLQLEQYDGVTRTQKPWLNFIVAEPLSVQQAVDAIDPAKPIVGSAAAHTVVRENRADTVISFPFSVKDYPDVKAYYLEGYFAEYWNNIWEQRLKAPDGFQGVVAYVLGQTVGNSAREALLNHDLKYGSVLDPALLREKVATIGRAVHDSFYLS